MKSWWICRISPWRSTRCEKIEQMKQEARITLVAPDFLSSSEERLCLEAKGLHVITSNDLSKALEALLNDPPDLLIIQKGLPNNLDKDVIQALKNNLQLALLPIFLVISGNEFSAGIDWDEYPVDDLLSDKAGVEEVIARVTLALARVLRVADNNPLTKLPGNSSILKTIQNILDSQKDRAIGYVDIDNFKPYNDRYGFARGDEVIRMVARILVNVIQEEAGSREFVGHVGGDDFVFAVPLELVKQVCEKILTNFNSLIPLFLDEADLEAGCFLSIDRQGQKQTFPLTSLSIAIVPCPKGKYKHYGEVASVAAQLKKQVKKLPGSNYLIDRRERQET